MSGKQRKIAVVTSTRADYGLLNPLLAEIAGDERLALQLLVTGTHLLPEFGHTIDEIVRDGFTVTRCVHVAMESHSPQGISRTIGHTQIAFGETFAELQPDLLVVPGDRYEMLAVSTAAIVAGLSTAHIGGGEVTEGAIDEMFRHSITKMSQLHFTATEAYRQRVIQLGEDPIRVFNTGSLALDNIRLQRLLTREELSESTAFVFNEHNLLVTYHPETMDKVSPSVRFAQLLAAIDTLADTSVIFTYPNADTHGRALIDMITRYVERNTGKACAVPSLGMLRYLSMAKQCDAMVGNSSSGIVEAPALQTATVNIGDRQKGRIRAVSIIDCEAEKASIAAAIRKAYEPSFRAQINTMDNPYGDGHAASRIKTVLADSDLSALSAKHFHDIR